MSSRSPRPRPGPRARPSIPSSPGFDSSRAAPGAAGWSDSTSRIGSIQEGDQNSRFAWLGSHWVRSWGAPHAHAASSCRRRRGARAAPARRAGLGRRGNAHPDAAWQDPDAVVGMRISAPYRALLDALAQRERPAGDDDWLASWRRADEAAEEAIADVLGSQLSEPQVARNLAQWLPDQATLFVASSMPILLCRSRRPRPRPGPRDCCRTGDANGIDGTVSSAFGWRRLTAFSGRAADRRRRAPLHDIGGLLAARRLEGLRDHASACSSTTTAAASSTSSPSPTQTDAFEDHVATPHGRRLRAGGAPYTIRGNLLPADVRRTPSGCRRSSAESRRRHNARRGPHRPHQNLALHRRIADAVRTARDPHLPLERDPATRCGRRGGALRGRRSPPADRAPRAPLVALALDPRLLPGGARVLPRRAVLSPRNTDSAHGLIFDEAYYVNAARVIDGIHPPAGDPYAGAPLHKDPNAEHPQLAKLIMAGGIELFGDNPWGWRIGSVIFGLLAIVAMYALVRAAGGSPWLAVGASRGDGARQPDADPRPDRHPRHLLHRHGPRRRRLLRPRLAADRRRRPRRRRLHEAQSRWA